MGDNALAVPAYASPVLGGAGASAAEAMRRRELGGIVGVLFHCCPCLVLDEVDGFGRMVSHGSTDFCLSGIFFSTNL